MDYERFDENEMTEKTSGINRQDSAEITPSEVVSTSAGGHMQDVKIQVDSKEGAETLKIYDIEKKTQFEYTDDPGDREIPKSGIE